MNDDGKTIYTVKEEELENKKNKRYMDGENLSW
jgi:hypothetical protein